MIIALSIKLREEAEYNLKCKLQHIPGEENVRSDTVCYHTIGFTKQSNYCDQIGEMISVWIYHPTSLLHC
jgi:hypothetical protein